MSTAIKTAIIESFSRKASTYAQSASVQHKSAESLARFLSHHIGSVGDGPVLELGCGTGLFTEFLLQSFPTRNLIVSDLSQTMLAECSANLNASAEQVRFVRMDAEALTLNETYALICASFSLQWVSEFFATIDRLLNCLKPDGQLIFSIPCSDSFKEWQQICSKSEVPFTANALPKKQDLVDWCKHKELSLEWEQQAIVSNYDSALDFFHAIKNVGAGVSTGDLRMSISQIKRLLTSWDESCPEKVQVTYVVLCARISRGPTKK